MVRDSLMSRIFPTISAVAFGIYHQALVINSRSCDVPCTQPRLACNCNRFQFARNARVVSAGCAGALRVLFLLRAGLSHHPHRQVVAAGLAVPLQLIVPAWRGR